MALCREYDALLSKTAEGSDVWRINNSGGNPVPVSCETMEILKKAREISEASGGAFNIAVGAAAALWRFTDGSAALPDADELAGAVSMSDYTNIYLGENVAAAAPGIKIDLGGIAKGYIADRIADYLKGRGVDSALINLGGNIVTVGAKRGGAPWSIGLQTPGGRHGVDFWAVVSSADGAVVTSGIYERGFALNGEWYHHILDPRTGYPVQNGLETVTICTKSSLLADALATACFVLGAEKGMELALRYGVHAIFRKHGGALDITKGLEIGFLKENG